jgi:hypothetical protein
MKLEIKTLAQKPIAYYINAYPDQEEGVKTPDKPFYSSRTFYDADVGSEKLGAQLLGKIHANSNEINKLRVKNILLGKIKDALTKQRIQELIDGKIGDVKQKKLGETNE